MLELRPRRFAVGSKSCASRSSACSLTMAIACSSPSGPTARLDENFVLAPGDSARVSGTDVSIRFIGVQSDSRCPADAVCIQGGDAIVRVEVLPSTGGAHDVPISIQRTANRSDTETCQSRWWSSRLIRSSRARRSPVTTARRSGSHAKRRPSPSDWSVRQMRGRGEERCPRRGRTLSEEQLERHLQAEPHVAAVR